jgi:hypothetical protein
MKKQESELYQPIFERVQKFISTSEFDRAENYIRICTMYGYITPKELGYLDIYIIDKRVETGGKRRITKTPPLGGWHLNDLKRLMIDVK